MIIPLPNGMIAAIPMKCERCSGAVFTLSVGRSVVSEHLVVLLDPPEFVRLIARDLGIVGFTLTCESCGCQCSTKKMMEVGMEVERS